MKKERRDFSMLYGVLAGFALFALVAVWIFAHIDWDSHVESPVDYLFPEGTQIIEERDSHGGFHGDGVAFLSAQIPVESSQGFAQLLREKGFTNVPISEELQDQLRGCSETCMAADIPNCLWWFQDESPKSNGSRDWFINYTLHLYDLDTSIYYYIEFDS